METVPQEYPPSSLSLYQLKESFIPKRSSKTLLLPGLLVTFLQDFDIVWKVTLGKHMGPVDALSHKDHVDTTKDNTHTLIHPDPLVVNTLDLTLSCHIQKSSASDPFILNLWYCCRTVPPHSLVPPSLTGPMIMVTFISKGKHMFPLWHAPPFCTLFILLPSQVIWVFSTPRLSWNRIFGSLGCPLL